MSAPQFQQSVDKSGVLGDLTQVGTVTFGAVIERAVSVALIAHPILTVPRALHD